MIYSADIGLEPALSEGPQHIECRDKGQLKAHKYDRLNSRLENGRALNGFGIKRMCLPNLTLSGCSYEKLPPRRENHTGN